MILNRILIKSFASSSKWGHNYYFSALKTKLQKIKTKSYSNVNQLFSDLADFQSKLDYDTTLKYQKMLEILEKKIKRLGNRKQNQSQEIQNIQKQHISKINFMQPLQISKTYTYLYKLSTESMKPSISTYKVRSMPLNQLYNIVCNQNAQKDRNIFYTQIVSKNKSNKHIYEAIRQRMEDFQHYLCMICFEGYKQFYCSTLQEETYSGKSSLKKLQGKEAVYESDFKFIPNKLTAQQLFKVSQIAKQLVQYNFITHKISLFAQLAFRQQHLYDSLTPESVRNYLYILAYCKNPLLNLQPKLYSIFDRLNGHYNQQKEYWAFQLLFYLLANKIENYVLIKQISEIEIDNISHLPNINKQILYAMKKLLQTKYQISLKSKSGNENIALPQQESQISDDFVRILTKNHYPHEIISDQTVSNDIIIEIQNKKYICMSANKFLHNCTSINKNSTKQSLPIISVNGIGKIILEYFIARNEKTKIINSSIIVDMDKFTKKQQYIKSKLKGVRPLRVPRTLKYDF